MLKNTKLVALLATLALSACTCEPAKPPLPEARVDSSFTFDDDAFSFPNFGGRGHGAALNPALVERLHGKPDVCEASSTQCRLTPIAKEYMRSVNDAMEGGRCEGFAVLSALMSSGVVDVTAFGSNRVRDLELDDNRALGAEIAYWFATQYLGDVVQQTTQPLSGEDAVRFLAESYAGGATTPFRVGIARVDEAGYLTGGHAVLATAVGPGDDEGTYFIYVYDNNLPEAERTIVVDVAANTWEYIASTNPDDPAALYRGTPDNGNVLFIAELPPREGQHPCAFCDSEADLQQVFGSAGAVVAVEDDDGAQAGEVGGRIVNEIEDSRTVPLASANNTDRAGTLTVLPRRNVTMTVKQGTPGADASVRLFAPNLMIAAENLTFGDDGTGANVVQTNADGTDVSFSPGNGGGGSSITVGSTSEDGTQTVTSVSVPPGESVDGVEITTGEDGNPTIGVDADDDTTVDVGIDRSGPDGSDSFSGSVDVPPGGSATLLVDDWADNGGELGAEVDEDGDGTPDQTVVVDETEPLVPPAAPTQLSSTAQGPAQIALSWTDNATDELAYEVERDDGAGFARIAALAADTTTFVDTGLTAQTAYSYRVRATADGTVSDFSNVATATTAADELFSIGGNVTGLRGFVVLRNRGTGEQINVDAAGTFTFATEQRAGATFDVAVVQNPRDQRCDVSSGLGVVRADVTGVVVTCVDVFFVGGEVLGLRSGGLVLENNGVDALPIDANGPFTFTTPVAVGDDYAVTVLRQAPGHECIVEAGAGVVDGPVSTVVVLCTPIDVPTYTVSVAVTGLGSPASPGLVLQNNGADDLPINADGLSVFSTPVPVGQGFAVSVLTQPGGATCVVQGGAGASDVDVIVDVVCSRGFRVGGTANGIRPGNVVTLVIEDRVTVDVVTDGPFTFPGLFPSGTLVSSVSILSEPFDQRCFLGLTTPTVTDADVLGIGLSCVDTFTVGGVVSAPAFAQVSIRNVVFDDVVEVVPNSTSFAFARRFSAGETYDVQATGEGVTCTVEGAQGVVDTDVTSLVVTCALVPLDLALTNPTTLPDVLPSDVELAGVEFDAVLSEPFAGFYGTPVRAEVRDGIGTLAATGTWALREGSQGVRITFNGNDPVITFGAPREVGVQGNVGASSPFTDDCPAGQVPIGFHAELGASVDGLAVVCGTVSIDPITLAVTVGDATTTKSGTTLTLRGSTNATQAESRCPANTMLVAFSGNAGQLIDRVDMQCAGLTATGAFPNLSVTVDTPVAGDGFGGNGGAPFGATSCAAGEVARGLTIEAGNSVTALGLRCAVVGTGGTLKLAAGDYQVSLLSNFALNAEAPADRVFARASQPLRVLPRGLTAVVPSAIVQGDPTVLIGQGVAVFGDAIVMIRQGSSEPLFRGFLRPQFCGGPTPAGCILQQVPFTAASEASGVYDVCVVPGVDENNIFGTLPASCPQGFTTLTILPRPGSVDTSFATQNLARLPETNERPGAVGFDVNGNIYVAGLSAGEAMVEKLFPDGTPDSSYGTVGFALAGLTSAVEAPGCLDVAADGTVTIATALDGTDGNANPAEIHVVRFTPGGAIDSAYGSATGTFIDDGNTFAAQYIVQGCKVMSTGQLVIGASFFSTGAGNTFQSMWRVANDGTFSGDSNVLNDPSFNNEQAFALVPGPGDTALLVGRLDTTASFLRIDNSVGMFVGNGWTSIALDATPTSSSSLFDAVVLGDGSFVAVGDAVVGDVALSPHVILVDAADNVVANTTFSAGGVAQGPYRIASELSGRFVVTSGTGGGGPELVRLLANLNTDPSWGTGGVISLPELLDARAIEVDASGRTVVAGTSGADFNFDGIIDGSVTRLVRVIPGAL
jgi:hypothetical protein